MYKKLFVGIAIILSVIFSFSMCFANDGAKDAVNGVRNVVGDAEKAVEDAAKDVSNASKDATGALENRANHASNDVKSGINNTEHNMKNNGNYNATRTATTANTFMGMNSTAWTWLIIGIAAIAIIALVWYYSMQLRSSDYDNRD